MKAAVFGATHVLNSRRADLVEAIRGITAGRMLDYVFVTVGVAAAVEQEKRIIGSRMGSSRLATDVRRLVALYHSHRIQLDELVSAEFPLSRINEAITATESGSSRRNVISFGQRVG